MKWIFLAALIALVPVLAGWLRSNPRELPKVCMLMGFLPFAIAPFHLYAAPISWAMWPGFVKGVEVSLLDAVALAIVLSAPQRSRRFRMKAPMLLFIGAVALSVITASIPMAASFYVWQLARVFLVFAAVAISCRDDRCPPAIVTGMVIGLAIQAVMATRDFLGGALQSGGGFGHQNQLGILSHFAVYPALALLLAGRKGVTPILGPVAGVVVAIIGASRATIGLGALGIALTLVMSMIRRPTGRKSGILFAGVAGLLIAAPLAINALNRRAEVNPLAGSSEEREAFKRAAWMMAADHPLGVGANYYVVAANTQGYSARAGVVPTAGSRGANVHNAYLLSAAEAGYPGLVTFTIMMLVPIWVAFRAALRNRRDGRGELLIGIGVALVMVAMHALYEWVFVTFSTEYLFGIALGLVSGLASRLGYWGSPKRRPRPLAAAIDEPVPAIAG